eukprot:gb/GECG01016810.1/.p1 GENE.gb/GECG01016810.1/~~gb/GECG01016810.1/.p1  ORF type:complete len:306 (+),score=32.66 gb/GECG01016810.1/:1-918(+)
MPEIMVPICDLQKKLCCCTKLGRRKRQEDRLLACPQIKDREDVGFYGVFDGTVGDDAAHFVQSYILRELVGTEEFENILDMSHMEFESPKARSAIRRALELAYRETDSNLLEHCAKYRLDYASSTAVTALITGKLLTVGSLGDSRIAIGRERRGSLIGEFLTRDHKPDQPEELKRIQSTGGSLTYLHGGKPFLRGGDFSRRQQRGDRPMQLNYSRAFGGKDLKCFGLSASPDITQLSLDESDHLVILASDGLWDVVDADTAVRMAWHAYINGRDASEDLSEFALKQHDYRGSIDNVTVVVIFMQH